MKISEWTKSNFNNFEGREVALYYLVILDQPLDDGTAERFDAFRFREAACKLPQFFSEGLVFFSKFFLSSDASLAASRATLASLPKSGNATES